MGLECTSHPNTRILREHSASLTSSLNLLRRITQAVTIATYILYHGHTYLFGLAT